MKNDVVCIVLNYNNYEDTIKCVDNILGMNCKVDIVIPDNNSTNDSFYILKKKYKSNNNVFVIRNTKNAGYSSGNNYGIKYAIKQNESIRYICIMNPDTTFDNPKLINKLKTKIDNHKEIAVVAPVMCLRGTMSFEKACWNLPDNLDFLKRFFVDYKWKNNVRLEYIEDKLAYVDVVHGSFFMISLKSLEQMGFFDENIFLYNEENAIGLKIKELGMREAICLDEKFNHNHPLRKNRLTLEQKLHNINIVHSSMMYICKTYYPKYLYPLSWIAKVTSNCIVVIKHILGSIVKRKNRGMGAID